MQAKSSDSGLTKRTNILSLYRNNILSPTNTVTDFQEFFQPYSKMANLKKMSDELKSFFAQEISASAVNVTTSINNMMNRKFNQLNEIDIRVNETKTLAENNTNRLVQLEEESKITNLRLEEYSRKIE